MKANELMIGDWVYNKNTDKTMQIYPMMLPQMFRRTPDATTEDYNIFPIPITPEILEKNGFTRDPLWHHCDKDFGNYTISVQLGYANKIEYIRIAEKGKDDVVPSERTKLYLTHIKYVHELQRALRLCGIEKEIEL